MYENKINRIAAKIDDLYRLCIPLDSETKDIIKAFINNNPCFNEQLVKLDGNDNTESTVNFIVSVLTSSPECSIYLFKDLEKFRVIKEQSTNFFNFVAQEVLKNCKFEDIRDKIINILDTNVQVTLSDIFSCDDFIAVYDSEDNNQSKENLVTLLGACKDYNYETIKQAVEKSSLSPENKKIVFAEVLPKYNFKVCSELNSTWDIFENGYIDFDTLVTKFWARDDFDKNDQNSDQNEKNVFQNFASEYKNYTDYQNNDIGSLKSSATDMINGLNHKKIIDDNDIRNLQNQIDNATDVGVLGIIAQFFKNLFSKDKTAFKPIQQTKQDRIISNLKPLSGLLREATKINKDIQQK